MKNLIFLIPFLLLVSCEKEVSTPANEAEEANEYFVQEFTEYTYQLNLTATGYTSPEHPQIYQQHEYRLAEGELVNGKYFYKIMRKSTFDYQAGSHSHDWKEMNGCYRYNFKDMCGEYHTNTVDGNYLTLMDFNLDIGDSFLVDDCSSISDLNFVVTGKETMTIGSLDLPVLKGKLIFTDYYSPQCSFESTDDVEVIPFSPSPFMRDLMFINLVSYDWTNDSFSTWQGSYCVTTILFSRKNHVRDEVEYQCVFKDAI